MINRVYTEGQQVDVADLNKMTILIDRSETGLTEVGHNNWRPGLDGPPHKHPAKEQVFYITGGEGKVILGGEKHQLKPGSLVYVPTGLVHQTINTGTDDFSYLLFNTFNDEAKEGHASFADHLEKVKAVRRKQADTGNPSADGEQEVKVTEAPKVFESVHEGKTYEFGSNSTILLIDRNEARRLEVTLVSWPEGNKGAMVAHKEKEQTFFVLKGKGKVTIGDETQDVEPGRVIFVPLDTPHTTEAVGGELTYLCFNSLIHPEKDKSFDEMYHRVAPARIERWKSGSGAVGE